MAWLSVVKGVSKADEFRWEHIRKQVIDDFMPYSRQFNFHPWDVLVESKLNDDTGLAVVLDKVTNPKDTMYSRALVLNRSAPVGSSTEQTKGIALHINLARPDAQILKELRDAVFAAYQAVTNDCVTVTSREIDPQRLHDFDNVYLAAYDDMVVSRSHGDAIQKDLNKNPQSIPYLLQFDGPIMDKIPARMLEISTDATLTFEVLEPLYTHNNKTAVLGFFKNVPEDIATQLIANIFPATIRRSMVQYYSDAWPRAFPRLCETEKAWCKDLATFQHQGYLEKGHKYSLMPDPVKGDYVSTDMDDNAMLNAGVFRLCNTNGESDQLCWPKGCQLPSNPVREVRQAEQNISVNTFLLAPLACCFAMVVAYKNIPGMKSAVDTVVSFARRAALGDDQQAAARPADQAEAVRDRSGSDNELRHRRN